METLNFQFVSIEDANVTLNGPELKIDGSSKIDLSEYDVSVTNGTLKIARKSGFNQSNICVSNIVSNGSVFSCGRTSGISINQNTVRIGQTKILFANNGKCLKIEHPNPNELEIEVNGESLGATSNQTQEENDDGVQFSVLTDGIEEILLSGCAKLSINDSCLPLAKNLQIETVDASKLIIEDPNGDFESVNASAYGASKIIFGHLRTKQCRVSSEDAASITNITVLQKGRVRSSDAASVSIFAKHDANITKQQSDVSNLFVERFFK